MTTTISKPSEKRPPRNNNSTLFCVLYEVGGDNFDGLAQDCSNSIANALELMQSIHACLSNCLSIS